MDKDIVCSNPNCKTPLLRFKGHTLKVLESAAIGKDAKGNGLIKCPKCGTESPMSLDDLKRF
jgi:hypothetical protein